MCEKCRAEEKDIFGAPLKLKHQRGFLKTEDLIKLGLKKPEGAADGLEDILKLLLGGAISKDIERMPLMPIKPHDEPKDVAVDESVKLETFGAPTKLGHSGILGKKISRKAPFMLSSPMKVRNVSGFEYPLLGFIKNKKTNSACWIMANGEWFSDPYFYVAESVEPVKNTVKKMTKADLEKLLGFKLEIEG